MLAFIHAFLWLWVCGAIGGSGYIVWALFIRGPEPSAVRARPGSSPQSITTRRTPSGPPPVARPAGAAPPARTSPLPPAVSPSGSPEHQRRGSAPTVKLPTTDPARAVTPPAARSADDDAAADLFSGLGAAKPAPPPAKDVVDKAGRIEEYGFHVGSKAANESGVRAAEASAAAAAAAAAAVAPAAPAPAPAPATSVEMPGQGRTQTQELDDILKRIDAVLSETGAPASEATMASQQPAGQQTLPVPTPVTEKTHRSETDPNQQKLF